jgi:hypothetical protein
MQASTTSSALLVQAKLIQLISSVGQIDPDVIEAEIEQYLEEHGVTSPGFLYDRNSIVASTWIIDHNLNKYPQVTLIDDEGNLFEADVFYNSLNQVTVVFSEPTSGKAVLI